MLKTTGSIFVIVTFLLLLGDSFFYPASSIKYFFIDSRFLYLIFIIFQITASFLNKQIIFDRILRINNYFVFPLISLTFLSAALINGFTYQFFAFNNFGMNLENYKYLFYLTGFLFMANIKASWLKTIPQKLLYFGGILYIVVFSFLGVLSPLFYETIIKEDGLLENTQVIFYFLASIISFISAFYFSKKAKRISAVFFLLLACGLFFIAGEELSWGQRLFDINTPQEYAKINMQEELTVHNLKLFQSRIDYFYMIVGLWGALSAVTVKKFIPALYKKYSEIFPQPILFFYFFAVTRFYFLNKFVVFNYQLFSFEKVGIGTRQEISETLLAFGFLCFALFTYFSAKRLK